MKSNNKGYILYEVLISFTLVFIIIINIFSTLTSLSVKLTNVFVKNETFTSQKVVYKLIGNDIVNYKINSYTTCNEGLSCYDITFDGFVSRIFVDKQNDNYYISYKGKKNVFPKAVKVGNILINEVDGYTDYRVIKLYIPVTYKKENFNIELFSNISTTGTLVEENLVTTHSKVILKNKILADNVAINFPDSIDFGSFTRTIPANPKGGCTYKYNRPIQVDGFFQKVLSSGNYSYYYIGDISNNYVYYVDRIWRIVRINDDGSIRLILENDIGNVTGWSNDYTRDENIENNLSSWFNRIHTVYPNLYSKIVNGWYCTRTIPDEIISWSYESISSQQCYDYKVYYPPTPNFECKDSLQLYGLIGYDDLLVNRVFNNDIVNRKERIISNYIYAESEYNSYLNNSVIQYNTYNKFTYKSSLVTRTKTCEVRKNMLTGGELELGLRPVINLNSNVEVLENQNGTINNPYVIQE